MDLQFDSNVISKRKLVFYLFIESPIWSLTWYKFKNSFGNPLSEVHSRIILCFIRNSSCRKSDKFKNCSLKIKKNN